MVVFALAVIGCIAAMALTLGPGSSKALPPATKAAFSAPGRNFCVEHLRLVGEWDATAMLVDGRIAPDKDVALVSLELFGSGFSLVLPAEKYEGTWDDDFDDLPWRINFNFEDGSKMRAIYRIDGDELKLSLSSKNKPPPIEFASDEESQQTIIVFRRKR